MTRSSKRALIILALFSIIIGFLWYIIQPLKVTDPLDPRFNPKHLRFHHYKTDEELYAVLKTIFPAGTPRAKVDKILTDIFYLSKSQEIPANDPGKAATYLVKLSDAWNDHNYYIDYTSWPLFRKPVIIDGGRTVGIRVLYNHGDHTVLEVHILFYVVSSKMGNMLQLRNPEFRSIKPLETPPEWKERTKGS